MAVFGANCVVDVSHHNTITDWSKIKADGIIGVIHKATEGLSYVDRAYVQSKKAATAAGLKWGSYHFSSGDDGAKQADHYLDVAKPTDDEAICFDVEPSSTPPNITYDQALAFVQRIVQQTGRLPVIYGGGSLLTTLMAGKQNSLLAQCPLWFADYNSGDGIHPKHALPNGWAGWTLWQYTGDGIGPGPHGVDGIVGNCDRDTYNGSLAELAAAWPLTRRTRSMPVA